MSELRTLLSLELRSLYGINKILHTRDKKEKSRYWLQTGAWLILLAMVFFYVGGLVYGLCALELQSIVPAYLVVLASILIIAFGFFTAGSRIFGLKGYDLLASMPVKTGNLVLSRFLAMYVEDLLLTLAVLVPGIAVYGVCQKPQVLFYLLALLGTLFVPAIPLVISTLLGTVVMAISARMKSKSMVQTLLMILLVVGVIVGSIGLGNLSEEGFAPEMLALLAQSIGGILGRIYPPALWLGSGLTGANGWGVALFAMVSLTVMVLAVFAVSGIFQGVSWRLQNFTAKHNYKIGTMESRGLLKALYIREAKRYFSSSIYVTNTIIGPILGAMMSVALCVVGIESIQSSLPIDISGVLPFVLSGVFCMMTTTPTAISMEGKQFWVVKSLPIPTKTLLDSKILLNLSLMLPFYLVSVAAMAIAVKAEALQLLWLILIPGTIILFSVILGITVNLKFHSFDWEKEETVVKQSLSAGLGGFAGFLLSAVLGFGVFMVPPPLAGAAKAVVSAALLVLTGLLYRKNNEVDLSTL